MEQMEQQLAASAKVIADQKKQLNNSVPLPPDEDASQMGLQSMFTQDA